MGSSFKRCFINRGRGCGAFVTGGQDWSREEGAQRWRRVLQQRSRSWFEQPLLCPLPSRLIAPAHCLLPVFCWHSCLWDNMLMEISSPDPANHAAAQMRGWKWAPRKGKWEVKFKLPSKCYSPICWSPILSPWNGTQLLAQAEQKFILRRNKLRSWINS